MKSLVDETYVVGYDSFMDDLRGTVYECWGEAMTTKHKIGYFSTSELGQLENRFWRKMYEREGV